MNIHYTTNILDELISGDILCITTNGTTKRNGACVMGRGIALEMKLKAPNVDFVLGDKIRNNGNIVQHIHTINGIQFLAFPVKHNWWEKADISLIKQSMVQLNKYLQDLNGEYNKCYLPAPGCGNGKLTWSEVEPVVATDNPKLMIVLKE